MNERLRPAKQNATRWLSVALLFRVCPRIWPPLDELEPFGDSDECSHLSRGEIFPTIDLFPVTGLTLPLSLGRTARGAQMMLLAVIVTPITVGVLVLMDLLDIWPWPR